jgi:hypothetical protein
MAVTNSKAATKCHFKLVLSDPEFIREYDILSKSSPNNFDQTALLKKFGLDSTDFNLHENGFALKMSPYTMFSAGFLKHNPNDKEFVATFNESISRDQFEDLWKLIQKNKIKINIKKSKIKPPEDPELLYAVFKSRIRGLTFPQIFDLYKIGELAYYKDKPRNNYETDFELRKYYSIHYKPV